MRLLHSSFEALTGHTDVAGTLSPRVFRRKAAATRAGISHEMRQVAHEMRQTCRPNCATPSAVTAREPKPGLDLGDLGAAHRDPMRRRAIKLDDGAVTLLADKGDMRDGHDVAAVHPDKQARVELGLGLRDRPGAHPLPGAVMDPGIMGVGPDASDIGGIDEMGAVGAFDRQPRRGCGARWLPDAAKRRRPQPRTGGAALASADGISTLRPAAASAAATASGLVTDFSRGSGTSDSRKPAAITKPSSVNTSDSICDDAASPSTW